MQLYRLPVVELWPQNCVAIRRRKAPAKGASLLITSSSYSDPPDGRQLGPTGDDFPAASGVGSDTKRFTPTRGRKFWRCEPPRDFLSAF
jgi:hypothetical protein